MVSERVSANKALKFWVCNVCEISSFQSSSFLPLPLERSDQFLQNAAALKVRLSAFLLVIDVCKFPAAASVFKAEDIGKRFFRNVGICTPDYVTTRR
jgi:hypothetical protein